MNTLIGYMPMPPNFPYAEIFKKGRPRHGIPGKLSTYDAFYVKHPPMENSRRAKIFAPFDALRGFNEAVAAKQILYEDRRELTEKEKENLDREMTSLRKLAEDRRRAREKPPKICITYFKLCEDPENDAFGKKGTYETVTGSLQKIDLLHRRFILDSGTISADDIIRIGQLQEPLLDMDG